MTSSPILLRLGGRFLLACIIASALCGCKEKVAASYCKQSDAVSTVSDSDASGAVGASDAGDLVDAGDAGDADAGSGASAAPDYSKLYCAAYSTTGSASLEIDIINFWADCGGPFKAELSGSSSTSAEITVMPNQCSSSGCLCPYDFSLNAGGLNLNSPIELTINRFSCLTMRPGAHETLTLHPEQSSDGIVCQYFGSTKDRHGLCANDNTCDEGLICRDAETLSGFDPVCLVPCEDRFDCPVPEAFTCDEGACVVIPNMTQTVGS